MMAGKTHTSSITQTNIRVFQGKDLSLETYVGPMAIPKTRYIMHNILMHSFREFFYPSLFDLHLHRENAGRDYIVGMGSLIHYHGNVCRTYMDEREGYMGPMESSTCLMKENGDLEEN